MSRLRRSSRSKEAVALQYDRNRDAAPRLRARGRGRVAERIEKAAQTAGVPVVVDPTLVSLLRSVPLESQVPIALYPLVAEVLAFVYSVSERRQPQQAASRSRTAPQ